MYFYGHKINLFCHSQFFRHLQEPSLWGKCQTQSDCKWLGRLSTNKKYENKIFYVKYRRFLRGWEDFLGMKIMRRQISLKLSGTYHLKACIHIYCAD